MTAPLNTASLVSELARESDAHVIAKLICEALAERDRALSEKEGEVAKLIARAEDAEFAISRLEKDIAVKARLLTTMAKDATALTRQRDEALAALKASEERVQALSRELASARLRPEPNNQTTQTAT